MAVYTTDTIIDRIEDVLEQYLNTEVDKLDTDNNAKAAESFTTPRIPDRAIISFLDDLPAEPITVTIVEEDGPVDLSSQSTAAFANEEFISGAPRILREHQIRIDVRADSHDSTGGLHGAYRMANRVKDAIRFVLAALPGLSIPADSTAALVALVELVNDDSPETETEGDGKRVRRSMHFKVLEEASRT